MKGVLTVLSGFSGVGKGTVVAKMKETHDFTLSISATTRDPRPGEVHGVSYYYISKEEFEARIADNRFLEHAQYAGNHYGTPKEPVLAALERGEDVLLEIESVGALQVKEQYPQALLIFMMPPSFAELERRLRGRATESEEVVRERLTKALEEISRIPSYDQIVINEEVEPCAEMILQLIEQRRYTPENMKTFIEQIHQEAESLLNGAQN